MILKNLNNYYKKTPKKGIKSLVEKYKYKDFVQGKSFTLYGRCE
jgi:biotin-(acetyl-CoA carboxylase) ligase